MLTALVPTRCKCCCPDFSPDKHPLEPVGAGAPWGKKCWWGSKMMRDNNRIKEHGVTLCDLEQTAGGMFGQGIITTLVDMDL